MRISWNKKRLDGKPDWILTDDDSGEIVSTITVLENEDGTYSVEGECKPRGYKGKLERVERYRLGSVLPRFKKNIVDWYHRLRNDAQRPTPKKVYEMLDGIPMWKHIKNDAEETTIELIAHDYGEFAETLGTRELNFMLFYNRGILEDIFDGIEIIRVQRKKKYKILETTKVGLGDKVFEINYKKDDISYGKKILVIEIKHGKFHPSQNQLRRYCSMVLNPGEHFDKADEVKVIYMMFDKIDTMNATASYSIKELDREFAKRILGRDTKCDMTI